MNCLGPSENLSAVYSLQWFERGTIIKLENVLTTTIPCTKLHAHNMNAVRPYL